MCIFKVHNVSQWPNLRHLAEPLGGTVVNWLDVGNNVEYLWGSSTLGRSSTGRNYLLIYCQLCEWSIFPVCLRSALCEECHRTIQYNTIQYNTMENLHSKTDKHTVSLI